MATPVGSVPGLFAATLASLVAVQGGDAWAQECSRNCPPAQRDAHGCCAAPAGHDANANAQHPPACAAPQHASAGHCCGEGEEWVEARAQCVCLDPSQCGAEHAASTQPEHPGATSYALRPETRTTPSRGGDDGAVFGTHCGAGQLATGVVVRSATGIDAVALECSAIDTDGTLGDPHTSHVVGGPGGTSASDRCPSGQALVAFGGRTDIRVERLAFHCGALRNGSVAAAATALTERGGTSGDPFSDACPAGYAITGLEGRANPEGVVAIRAVCTRVAPPNGANYVINATQHRALAVRGVATVGTHYAMQCPTGDVAVGITGRHSSMISSLAVDCARLYPDGSIGEVRARGEAGGVSGEEFDDRCPDGEVLVGLNGRTGRVVDRLGAQCAPVARWLTNAAEPRSSSGHGGNGGDPFVDNCPTGHVVDSIAGSAGNLIDSLQIQCVRVQR